MRRIPLVLFVLTVGLALPSLTLAAPYPAASQRACERAGGTFYVDKSSDPIVKECDVSLHDASVTLWNGSAPGYVVEVSTSDSVHFYYMSDGQKSDFILGGALGITDCWLNDVEVPLSDTNCTPTTPI